jgi:hypothetical protein
MKHHNERRDIIDRKVQVRTVNGPMQSEVLAQMTLGEANRHVFDRENKKRRFHRKGTYCLVTGIDIPVHRRRIKLLP